MSLEINYKFSTSGFAVRLKTADSQENGKRPAGFADPKFDFTPDDILACGFEYIPVAKSPLDLQKTFSKKRNRIINDWQKREVFLLMNGVDVPVHYAGMGVVKVGAEEAASISLMAASGDKNASIFTPFSNLAKLLSRVRVK